MPLPDPRDPHAQERAAERERAYRASVDEYHREHDLDDGTSHLTAAAIVKCGMCDDDGYRGGTVCDHRDHYESTTNGRAAVQAELDKIREKQSGTP